MDSVTGLAIDQRAIAAAEVLDEHMIVIHGELRVPPRDQFGVHLHLALQLPSDDVIARSHGLAQKLRAVLGDDDLGFGDLHEPFAVSKSADTWRVPRSCRGSGSPHPRAIR